MGLSLTWLLLAALTGLELVLFQQVLHTAQQFYYYYYYYYYYQVDVIWVFLSLI